MSNLPVSLARVASAAFLTLALLSGCTDKETGIPTRHLQGIATLPPLALFEAEPADPLLLTEENPNDSLQTADGPFGIGVGYHIVRGHSYRTCDRVAADQTADDLCSFNGPQVDDVDWFRVKSQYQGPVVFKARPVVSEEDEEAGVRADLDIQVLDKQGAILFTDTNAEQTELDENGDPVLDENGDPRTFFADPRYATQVLVGTEFFLRVTVNSNEDGIDYEVIVVGNDPREHFIDRGLEGDAAVFDFGAATEVPRQAPYEIKVGAYLNDNVEDLGDPVGGSSCDSWTLDEVSETFWCTWSMVFLNQVTRSDASLIPGMGDGKDNECNGVADSGTEEADMDGDLFTGKDGDCNDTDATIGPFRGDTFGDFKDNDCDGWADNGPDDVDDDGDGFCENGRDVSGDGFCRGASEVGGSFATGDCNDTDPRIRPALSSEIASNGLDDDCADGDARLSTANADSTQTAPDPYTDLEEEACGTDPFSRSSSPVDEEPDPVDGLCDSDCLGTVGCTQDWDGDNFHNWLELQCATDPEAVTDAMPDFDGDGECDGMDADSDNDGFPRKIGQDGTDCNDLDAGVHPHPLDEDSGVVVDSSFNYDVVDGIDNDCDGQIDENRDWERNPSGAGFVPSTVFSTDQDGDGFAMAQRDCNDTDTAIYFGNWEVRSANVVSTDFSLVHLFAGELTSLNSTTALAGQRMASSTVPYDLQKSRVAWELVADWEEGDPPALRPVADGLPRLDVWFAKQPEVGKLWFEELDATGGEIYTDPAISGFVTPPGPWEVGTYQDLGDTAAPGKTNELNGASTSVVADTWDGDADGYRVRFPEGGIVNLKLEWEGAKDLDAVAVCYYFDSVNAPNYYSGIFSPGLAGFASPESGTSVVPFPPGADCYFFIVTYSGSPGSYVMSITVLE